MPLNRLRCCDAREPLSRRASRDICNAYVPTNERRSVPLYRHAGALYKALNADRSGNIDRIDAMTGLREQ